MSVVDITADATLSADSEMDLLGEHWYPEPAVATTSMVIVGDAVPGDPHPWRRPHHASQATASSTKQYEAARQRVGKAIAVRNRLPRTQVQLNAQRARRR